jgi:hypothetical protein
MPREWHQCDHFKFSDASEDIKLKLKKSIPNPKASIKNSALIFLISQDCDLCAKIEHEPYLEFLVAEIETKPAEYNGNSRSSRYLNIEIEGTTYKLKATKQCFLPKPVLDEGNPFSLLGSNLDESQARLIKRWLAQRYSRKGLPDTFNHKVKDIIANLHNIKVDLYLRFENESEGLDLYRIAIISIPYADANLNAEDSQKLNKEIVNFYDQLESIEGIEIDSEWLDDNECTPVIDRSEVTLSLLDKFSRWNLDYISYREEDFKAAKV